MTSPLHHLELAAELVRRYALTPRDLVVEIGSGDGLRLQAVRELGPRVLGIEPDVMAMTRAWAAGIDTIAAAFGPGVADYIRLRYGAARVLMANCSWTEAIVAAGTRCLEPGGAIVFPSAGVNAFVEVRPELPRPAARRAA